MTGKVLSHMIEIQASLNIHWQPERGQTLQKKTVSRGCMEDKWEEIRISHRPKIRPLDQIVFL